MKKRIAYSLASMVAISSLGAPIINAYAQTEQPGTVIVETKEIKDPQDFIDLYCSFKKETKNPDGSIQTTYTVFETVDEFNYLSLLSGQKQYEKLDQKLRQQIDDLLMTHKKADGQPLNKNFNMLYEEALKVQAAIQEREEITEDQTDSKEDTNTPPVTEGKPSKEETTPSTPTDNQKPEASQPVDSKEETETVKDTMEETPFKEEEETAPEESQPTLKEETTEESQPTLKEENTKEETTEVVDTKEPVVQPMLLMADIQSEETLLKPQLRTVVETPKAPVIETEAPVTAPIVQPVEQAPVQKTVETTSVQTTQPKVSQKVTLDSMDKAVQDFVQKYLMDSNGKLYTTANTTNSAQILSGVSSYSDLSTDKVSQLNSYLVANGSQKYFSLVAQAQRIQNGGRGVVDTAAASGFGLYGALLTLSSVGFGFLFKNSKKKA